MKRIVPPFSFETGIDVEKQSFTWAIGNYPLLRMHKSMIDSQKIDFTAGDTTSHLSHWRFCLREIQKDGKRWIGIFLNLRSPEPTDATLKTTSYKMRYAIKDKDGKIINDVGGFIPFYPKFNYDGTDTRPKHIATDLVESPEWGTADFIDADNANTCQRGSLVIHITFKLYTPSQPKSTLLETEAIMDKFQVTFSDRLRKDLGDLRKNPVPCTDIKIVSNDKKEFTVKRGILAVRSEVFAAMLSSDMVEASSGVIQLPDMSSKAVDVLLNFVYTGELDPDWNHAEVLVELTNAAGKYQLPDLLQFLDATLGKVCKVENVLELFTLAHQLSLKTAEEELSKYISVHSISPENCCEMLKGIISFPGPAAGPVQEPFLEKIKSGIWTLLASPFKVFFPKK